MQFSKFQSNKHKENGSFQKVFTVPIIDRIQTTIGDENILDLKVPFSTRTFNNCQSHI